MQESNHRDENIKNISISQYFGNKTAVQPVLADTPALEAKPLSALSEGQRDAFDKFASGKNVFITGPGGTGKTRLVEYLVNHSKIMNRKIQVCAMTGCAAVLLGCNARTVHSWSGIKLAKGPSKKVVDGVLSNRNAVREWKKIQCLVLDEVSMLSQKIFEILDEIGRRARNNPLPFGGIQVVFLGDFYQLPPIETANDPGTGKFCFESPVWFNTFSIENHVELTHIFRQKDRDYIEILMQIRKGELDKDKAEILNKYVNRDYDIDANNGCVPPKLFAIRSKVDLVNKNMFSKLDCEEYVSEYTAKTDCTTYIDTGKAIPLELLQKCNALSGAEKEYEIENLSNNTPCAKIARFKKGASVMCSVNLDMDNNICNGSQGTIIDILESPDSQGLKRIIVVKFSNGIIKRILPYSWQSDDYPTIAVEQYPLILSWALTIHKIQGATMELAEIDIGSSIFEYGQTYVALSRVQSLNGLYLSAFNPDRILSNPIVTEFYNRIRPVATPK